MATKSICKIVSKSLEIPTEFESLGFKGQVTVESVENALTIIKSAELAPTAKKYCRWLVSDNKEYFIELLNSFDISSLPTLLSQFVNQDLQRLDSLYKPDSLSISKKGDKFSWKTTSPVSLQANKDRKQGKEIIEKIVDEDVKAGLQALKNKSADDSKKFLEFCKQALADQNKPKIEPKIEGKIEPKIEGKTQPKIEPKIEGKTQPKIEGKTQGADKISHQATFGKDCQEKVDKILIGLESKLTQAELVCLAQRINKKYLDQQKAA